MQLNTTMAVRAQSQHYYEFHSLTELHAILAEQFEPDLALMVLGQGSNTIFRQDYTGIVLANRLLGRKVVAETEQTIDVCFGGGENWHDLVAWSLQNQWYGLENLALIPGLIGAAPIQNIGAYGIELSDVFTELSCLDIATNEQQTCSIADCRFAYRDSIFKHEWADKKVITSVTLRLSKKQTLRSKTDLYPALRSEFADTEGDVITSQQVFDAVCRVRSSKLPDPQQVPNSGSFFKNPVVSHTQHQQLKQKFPDLVAYALGEQGYKLAAGWLIEAVGLKGYSQDNGVGCYAQQALVIINPQHCTGAEVLAFAGTVQNTVEERFGVKLEIEPRIY